MSECQSDTVYNEVRNSNELLIKPTKINICLVVAV